MTDERFETLVRLSPVGMFRTDASGACVFVNERWTEIVGIGSAAARGEGWIKALHPEDRERVVREWQQAAEGSGAFRSEYRFQRDDGRVTWVLGHAVPEHDEAGRLVGHVGTVTEITDRKRAEDALRRVQDDHAQLINSIDGIVWEAEVGSLDFLFVNQHAERILGYPLSEWFDTPNAWIKYLHPEDRDQVIEYCVTETKAGRGHDFEYRMIAADGRVVWLRDMVSFTTAADGSPRLRGVMIDVTDLMEAKRALKKSKEQAESASLAKSRFLATMSHELRTPLNAIMGFAEAMGGDAFGPLDTGRTRAYAGDIHASAAHLLQIINDILDVARIEAGKFDLERETLEPASLLHEVRQIMAKQAETASLALRVEAVAAPLLLADRRALRQVLLNLVSNAVKFTPAGGSVTLGAGPHASGGARLWVADTGVGIAKDDIARLGQPFVQLNNGYVGAFPGRGQGIGLGLMLVRSLVQLHGGTMDIASTPGRGTTVSVLLPETGGAALAASRAS